MTWDDHPGLAPRGQAGAVRSLEGLDDTAVTLASDGNFRWELPWLPNYTTTTTLLQLSTTIIASGHLFAGFAMTFWLNKVRFRNFSGLRILVHDLLRLDHIRSCYRFSE